MAEIFNTSVFSQTDANNNSGTLPTWAEGMPPSQANDSARALQGALTRFWNWVSYTQTSGGSGNAHTLTYAVAPDSLGTGQRYAFKAGFTNSGATTLNINGLGVKGVAKIINGVKTALVANDIVAGDYVEAIYDGTDFVLTTVVDLSAVASLAAANVFIASSQTLQYVDAGAAAGPGLNLVRTSASPAAGDLIGEIPFVGNDTGVSTPRYATIYTRIIDATSGSVDGRLCLRAIINGTETDLLFVENGVYTPNATGGAKGADTINAGIFYKQGVNASGALVTVQDPYAVSSGPVKAHSVANPTKVDFYLECKTADLNYAVGDKIPFASIADGATANTVPTGYWNATNVGSTNPANLPRVMNKVTAVEATITAANWKIMALVFN